LAKDEQSSALLSLDVCHEKEKGNQEAKGSQEEGD